MLVEVKERLMQVEVGLNQFSKGIVVVRAKEKLV